MNQKQKWQLVELSKKAGGHKIHIRAPLEQSLFFTRYACLMQGTIEVVKDELLLYRGVVFQATSSSEQ